MNIIDTISADTIEVGDQVIIEGDPVGVTDIQVTMDPDEVIVIGYSYESGDSVEYSLYADDYFDIWAV